MLLNCLDLCVCRAYVSCVCASGWASRSLGPSCFSQRAPAGKHSSVKWRWFSLGPYMETWRDFPEASSKIMQDDTLDVSLSDMYGKKQHGEVCVEV